MGYLINNRNHSNLGAEDQLEMYNYLRYLRKSLNFLGFCFLNRSNWSICNWINSNILFRSKISVNE